MLNVIGWPVAGILRGCISTACAPSGASTRQDGKCLGTDDFGGKAFATKLTDRLIGCRDIAVSHGCPHAGKKALGVVFISRLPGDKSTPDQR